MRALKAYSIKTTRVRENDFPYPNTTITSPADVARFAHSLQDSDVEKFLVLYLNSAGRLICIKIWEGTANSANVYVREILKLGLLCGAVSVIAVHNHPSGDPTPSAMDQAVTQAINSGCRAVGLDFKDHVVISGTSNEYASIVTGQRGRF